MQAGDLSRTVGKSVYSLGAGRPAYALIRLWRDGSRLGINGDMSRILTVFLGLLILSGCVTHPRKPADQGLCESEKARNGKVRIICH